MGICFNGHVKKGFFILFGEAGIGSIPLSKIVARQLLIYEVNACFHANVWQEIPEKNILINLLILAVVAISEVFGMCDALPKLNRR